MPHALPREYFGGEIRNGPYLAQIDIVPADGEPTQWRWAFEIDSPSLAGQPPAALLPAAITNIDLEGERYVVDFVTNGFEPTLPGQHVHFFFSTVPPEQAGVPGSGPWQLYPASAGQYGSSPFTLLGPADRPPGATQLCILVANPDHSVQLGTGNCFDLP